MTTMTFSSTCRLGLLSVSALALLAGCVTGDPVKPKFVEAVAQEPPRIEATIAPDVVPAFQQTLKRIDDDAELKAADGLEAIDAARREALVASASPSCCSAPVIKT